MRVPPYGLSVHRMGSEITTKRAVICVPRVFILLLVLYFTSWCSDMDEERYLALLGYIKSQEYPAGLTRSEKYILKRASKSYEVVGDQLY